MCFFFWIHLFFLWIFFKSVWMILFSVWKSYCKEFRLEIHQSIHFVISFIFKQKTSKDIKNGHVNSFILSCFNQIINLMQFEAILSDLNFQKWDKQTQTWQMPRSLSKQALLKLKNAEKLPKLYTGFSALFLWSPLGNYEKKVV